MKRACNLTSKGPRFGLAWRAASLPRSRSSALLSPFCGGGQAPTKIDYRKNKKQKQKNKQKRGKEKTGTLIRTSLLEDLASIGKRWKFRGPEKGFQWPEERGARHARVNPNSVAQSRPFNLLVFQFWSIFSHGPKRLTFYFWVLWANEQKQRAFYLDLGIAPTPNIDSCGFTGPRLHPGAVIHFLVGPVGIEFMKIPLSAQTTQASIL